MKKLTFILAIIALALSSCNSDEPLDKNTLSRIKGENASQLEGIQGIAAMGASLISPENNWFQDGCDSIGATSYNKAISSTFPYVFAEKLWRNTFCTDEEFENIDILVIQFANCKDVYMPEVLKQTIDDYSSDFDYADTKNPFLKYNHAQNLDYILKFWKQKCYEQKFNRKSKYYNSTEGKPFRIVLVTHWHDARTTYNEAIRKVAEKWNCPVCELDRNIGFTKDIPLENGMQVSVLFAHDTEVIDGITYGWHPQRGVSGRYIQSRMASIFAKTIKNHFTHN